MKLIQFKWDPQKNLANQKKHGISFEEARSVFMDDHAKIISDPDHSVGEERFILLGVSNQSRILLVCHCYRETDEVIRIISARKANKHEKAQYRGR